MAAYLKSIWNLIDGQNIAIVLFFVGVYGMLARRNIIKTILSYAIMQGAIVLFFVSINANLQCTAPIGHCFTTSPADPLPHALMITHIIIGTLISAVAMTMFITLYHSFGSTNWNKVRRKYEGKL